MTTPETQHIWDGYRRGEIVLQGCEGCGSLRFLPAYRCQNCGAATWKPVVASGRGTVHSYIVTRRPSLPVVDRFPITVLVELDEGPRLVSNLDATNAEDVRIGMPVVAYFDSGDDLTLVRFRSAEWEGAR